MVDLVLGQRRDVGPGDGAQAPARSFEWIVPANTAGHCIEAEDLSAGGGVDGIAIKGDVDELAFERRAPILRARPPI